MTYQEILDELNAHSMTVRVLEEPHPGHVFLRVCFYKDEAKTWMLIMKRSHNI
jgi:hypothetical protein